MVECNIRSSLEHVATCADGRDTQAHSLDPPPETEDVNVEGVPSRRTLRPACSYQLVAPHDRPEASGQSGRDARFDGWQGDTSAVEPQHPVGIHLGCPRAHRVDSQPQRGDPSPDVRLGCRDADPVLGRIVARRRGRLRIDQ